MGMFQPVIIRISTSIIFMLDLKSIGRDVLFETNFAHERILNLCLQFFSLL